MICKNMNKFVIIQKEEWRIIKFLIGNFKHCVLKGLKYKPKVQ